MTKTICTNNSICTNQIYEQTFANQKNEKSVWNSLTQLAGTIGSYAVEVYRFNNDPEPVFSNGGTRVLFRLGRIDLV
jgi:hypothetical protein